MGKSREGEEDRTRFRMDRFFAENDKWFFSTREGTIEGPYDSRKDAEQELEVYLVKRRRMQDFGIK